MSGKAFKLHCAGLPQEERDAAKKARRMEKNRQSAQLSQLKRRQQAAQEEQKRGELANELMVAKKETEALRRKLFSTTMLMAKVQQRAINRNISSQLLAKLAVIVEKSKIKL